MIDAKHRPEDTTKSDKVEQNDSIFDTTQSSDPSSHVLSTNKPKMTITDTDIVSTSILFFAAGYETTATILSFLLYLLALNENCQQKLYEEVNGQTVKNETNSYDNLTKLSYLEACIAETLRLYTPVSLLGRTASEDYTIGNTGITVEKGTTIIIPIHALHHSPDYFPEPKQYRPERFLPENRDKIIPYTYLPFGAGPRNCVGMRFALMEAKAVVARMVIKYEFIRTANTKVPLQYVSKSSIPRPTDFTVGVHYRSKIG
ncbi:cytochrome P450 3A19-like [Oppia nitens]|uniref:cytochrome P450 3A19-like n=1 Tax=Oppia nitens TaxID=1686743 RepID=UPI0023DB6994|nr:cytochrome P450 3A19-like [Oppia nitens]